MKVEMHKKWQAAALAAILAFSAGGPMVCPTNVATGVVYAAQVGGVAWEQGERASVEAYGYGVAKSENEGSARGKILARRAAVADAYRNLAEIIQGVQVNSETTMHNLAVQDDTIRVRVDSLVKGAEIVKEAYEADGTYSVSMRIPLYGKKGLAAVAFPAVRTAKRESFPPVSPQYETNNALPGEILEKQYTGVIIDARGLGLNPTFSPVILDDNGRKIYGHENIDTEYAIEHGMVGYTKEDVEAERAESGDSRAGETPLVIKAVGLDGHNCNVIIAQSDADFILTMNQKYGFLDSCAVVFER